MQPQSTVGRSRKRTRLGRENGVRFLMLLPVAYGIGSFFRPLEEGEG